METILKKNALSGFAYYLAESGVLDKQVALDALQQATLNKSSYLEFLTKQKILDESQVARTTAGYFGLPCCDINAFDTDLIPSEFLNIQLVRKHLALPIFKKNGVLFLAISDPTVEYLSEVRFLTGMDTRLIIVEAGKLAQAIDELLNTLILSEISVNGEDDLTNITVNAYKDDTPDLA